MSELGAIELRGHRLPLRVPVQPAAVRDPADPRGPSRVARRRGRARGHGDEGGVGCGRRPRRARPRGRRRRDGPPERRHRCGRGAQRHAPLDERAARGHHLPRAISSSPTSRCRRRSRATRPASSAARMACCCSRRSRAGAGSAFQDLEEEVQTVSAEEVVARIRGTARREVSTHRRRLVRAVSDAPADRLAPGGRPAVPDRRRRPPVEPVRRGRAQLGPA